MKLTPLFSFRLFRACSFFVRRPTAYAVGCSTVAAGILRLCSRFAFANQVLRSGCNYTRMTNLVNLKSTTEVVPFPTRRRISGRG
jgi:hypothetical protein